jgi:hypothetical protein
VRPVRPNFSNPRGSCDSFENSRAVFVDQAQDQGIKAVGPAPAETTMISMKA